MLGVAQRGCTVDGVVFGACEGCVLQSQQDQPDSRSPNLSRFVGATEPERAKLENYVYAVSRSCKAGVAASRQDNHCQDTSSTCDQVRTWDRCMLGQACLGP